MRVTAWAQLISGVMLTLIGLSLGGRLGHPGWSAVGVFAYICFASCMGYSIWNKLVKYNDLTRLNEIKFTEPLFSAICSAVLLGENIFRLSYLFSFVLVATVGSDSAKVFLAMAPMLLVYPFAQKYFIHGMVASSVKE